MIAFAEQFFCGLDKTHQEALKHISLQLLENQGLFDLVHEGNFSLERLRRFRAVIVPPGVRSLSEAQLEVFRRYAAENPGGLFILGEDFGTADEKCRSRAPRPLEGASILPATVPPGALLARVSQAIGRPCASLTDADGGVPPGVGINAFVARTADDAGHILFHLVNYNVPLGQNRTDPPRPVRNPIASLPLPPGWKTTSVAAFSPHPGEELGTELVPQKDGIRLQIPQLDLYQVIRVTGQVSPPQAGGFERDFAPRRFVD